MNAPDPARPDARPSATVPDLSDLKSLDLYVVLGMAPTADTATLRERISALYREALANAEHRELKKRLFYDQLLDVLPRCYNILLDAQKRTQYDAFLRARQRGEETEDFETYLQKTSGQSELDVRSREGLLEIRENTSGDDSIFDKPLADEPGEEKEVTPASPSVIAVEPRPSPVPFAAEIPAPPVALKSTASNPGETPNSSKLSAAALLVSLGGGMLSMVAGRGVLRWPLSTAILAGILLALAVGALFWTLSSRPLK